MDQWQVEKLAAVRRKANVKVVNERLDSATLESLFVQAAPNVETAVADSLQEHGPDATIGNMEEARIQAIIDAIGAADLPVPDGLTAADMFTNEFLDESIGF